MEVKKVLSVKNPWAWLICAGYKDVENRTWKTNYRGKILIHTSKTNRYDCEGNKESLILHKIIKREDFDKFKNIESAIIGECIIVDCVKNYNSVWAEKDVWNWIIKDAKLYDKPIENIKGKLGVWNYE